MGQLYEALVLASCMLLAVAVAQGQSTESYGDMISRIMDEHKERAIARWKEERAQWEAMLVQAESQANPGRALKSAWVAPPVNNTGPVKYVDLSQWPSQLKSSVGLKAAFNWNARGARYPRFPKLNIPVPSMLFSCPEGNSVKSFGAVGDGKTDDSGAIMGAAAEREFLYFPPGNYRIASSITVNKPMVFAQRSSITTDKGVVLTITKRIRWWNAERTLPAPLFLGSGTVKFAGDCDIVIPYWFKAWGEKDSDAFQKAVDGCQGSCTMVVNRELFIDKPVFLKPNVGTFFGVSGQLIGVEGNGNGLVLTPGKYNRPIYMTTLWNFTNYAVKVQGGVTGADIQLAGIDKCGDGIVFAPDEGAPPLISNVHITQLNSLNKIQNQVVILSNSPRNRLKNCLVSGGFVNGPGQMNINAPASGLVFRGRAPPILQGTSFIFQSFETGMYSTNPSTWSRVVWVQNLTPKPANNVVFKVEAWGGGTTEKAVNSMLAQGAFNGLKLLVANGGGWAPSAQNSWRITGKKNSISNGEVSNAGLTWSAPSTPKIALWKASVRELPAAVPVVDGVFYVKIPVGTWRSGETRSFYAWTAYARISNVNTRIRRDWVVFRAYNPGLVVSSIENQNNQQDGRIKLNVKNIGGDVVMSDWRFGVQMV